jgi:ABC-type transport system involved in multi-copper enzyme maturation permease subunit
MNRQTRLAVRLLAVGVIVVGAVVLLPHVLDGVAILLNAIRRNWWLVVLVALAVWGLLASGKKR